jgi:hypothetical protein
MTSVAPIPPNPASPSAAVERRFYTIVRWFGLITTSIALAIAVIVAANGLIKLLPPASGGIRNPSTTYEDFKRETEARRTDRTQTGTDTTFQQKQAAATNAASEAEFERRLKPLLDAIVASLVSYSEKVNQPKPSAQAVGDYVRSNMQQVLRSTHDDGIQWDYVEHLEKAAHDLAADSDRLSKLGSDDPRRVRWDTFLDWFTRRYNQQIQTEIQRINSEVEAAIANAAEAPALFYASAVAFGFFICGTLLLLVLRIEMNTRS